MLVVDSEQQDSEARRDPGRSNAPQMPKSSSGLNESEMVVYGEQSQFRPGELVKPKIVTPAEMEKE